MAGLTARFRLNRFGGRTPGTIVDDGQKYTSADRDAIDRLLAQTELHDHRLRADSSALAAPLTAQLLTTGGTLQAGNAYRYRYSVVDADGLESVAGPAVVVSTPSLLAVPGMTNLYVNQTDVGTLAAGNYYYAVTALRGTEETPLGPATTITVITGEGAVRVVLPALGSADSFRVWRMGMTEAGFTKLGLTTAAEFIDNGAVPADPCACDPGNTPPQVNSGVGIFAVTVTLPVGVDLSTSRAWRLYRSPYTTFGSSSLVHSVVERTAEWDPTSALLRTWTDTGAALTSGAPMDVDQNMRFQPFTLDNAAALPDPASYPPYYPIVVDKILYAKIGAVWVAIGGASGGGTASSVLTSPDGSRFITVVANDGSLSTVSTLFPGPPTPPQNVTVS